MDNNNNVDNLDIYKKKKEAEQDYLDLYTEHGFEEPDVFDIAKEEML